MLIRFLYMGCRQIGTPLKFAVRYVSDSKIRIDSPESQRRRCGDLLGIQTYPAWPHRVDEIWAQPMGY
jgi:hypothetical protein